MMNYLSDSVTSFVACSVTKSSDLIKKVELVEELGDEDFHNKNV